MKRSVIRVFLYRNKFPDYVELHPGYVLNSGGEEAVAPGIRINVRPSYVFCSVRT